MAVSSTHRGWRFDRDNSRLDFYYNGTRAGHIDANGLTVASGTLTAGALTATGAVSLTNADISMPNLPTAACCLASGDVFVALSGCCCCIGTLRIVP